VREILELHVNEKTAKVLRYIKERTKDGSFLHESLEKIGQAIGMPAYQVSRELAKLRGAGIIEIRRGMPNTPLMYRYVGLETLEEEELIESVPAGDTGLAARYCGILRGAQQKDRGARSGKCGTT